jgi:hypothetical protein
MMEPISLDAFVDSSTVTYRSYNVPRIILSPRNGILMTARSGSTTMNSVTVDSREESVNAHEGEGAVMLPVVNRVGLAIDDQTER